MRRKLWTAITVVVLLSSLLGALPLSASAPVEAVQSSPPPGGEESVQAQAQVTGKLAPELAMSKLDPALRQAAEKGGKNLVELYVAAKPGTDLSKYMSGVIVQPIILGKQNIYGQATADTLLAIAQEPGVIALVSVGNAREKPYDPEEQERQPNAAAAQARLETLRANELTFAQAQAQAGQVGTRGWFDVQDGHKAAAAWEKGFTGEGVVVAVLDDGVDFAHPDLQGTFARVTDANSPYYGWPMAFSELSMWYFVQDVNLGTHYIANSAAGSHWSDTQFTVEAHGPFGGGTAKVMYQPVGSGIAHEYTIPTTSQSNFYKLGSHPDQWLATLYGESVAVLVVDEHVAGVYDTVYVDLDNDYDFTDEKPATRNSPEIYRDMDGDGYADISGGLLVWVSNGNNTPPAADWLWGITCANGSATMQGCPDAGELVQFAGPFNYSASNSHGTLCASNIVGQGVIAGGLSTQPFTEGGVVQGAAREARLMDFGDHYSGVDENEFLVAAYGFDGVPNTGDEAQILSNSYGQYYQMWGSWGYIGRLITTINLTVAPTTLWIFSTGNAGPGYGPQEGDGSPTTLMVGSSTQYGSTDWDSIFSADQIMYGDPNAFYAHGPNRDGSSGVDVLANGGRGSGDDNLNFVFDGWTAWQTWGGTSRSAPFAAGSMALIYQAYRDRYGEWPTWDVAKALIKNGAVNSVSSPFFQGAGVVNADRATDLAAGIYGVYATPDEWQVGDWEGEEYLNFAKVAYPGDTFTKTYTIYNPSGYDINAGLSDGVMTLITKTQLTFTTSDQSEESPFMFNTPDYLMELDSDLIPADADVMIVRFVQPYDTFDPVYDFTENPNSSWRFLLYNWTDQNGDGMLWEDANNNGTVNHTGTGQFNNDGFEVIDFANTEIQEGEYIRVDYNMGGTSEQFIVRDPLERMADGYFVGWQHRINDGTVPTTTFKIGVEFYKRADWSWLSLSQNSVAVPAEGEATFVATLAIPSGAEPGVYEGVVFMNDPGNAHHAAHETALPVVVNVISDLPDGGSFTLGGEPMADTMYQNSYTFGYFGWAGSGWEHGIGDWRHYFFNVDTADMAADNLLIHTSWDGTYPTDINTWILGPTYDCASNGAAPCAAYAPRLGQPDPSVFGPYTLQPIGSSDVFRYHSAYPFLTTTGGPDDWLKVPLQRSGLHEIALHTVLYDGEQLAEQFQVDVGTLKFEPTMDPAEGTVIAGSVDAVAFTETGTIDLEFTPTLAVPDLYATLSGGLATNHFDHNIYLPNSGQCNNGAWCADTQWTAITLDAPDATRLLVYIPMPAGEDVDLFVYRDQNGNGLPDQGIDTLAGSSTRGAGSDDFVSLTNPAAGTYLVGILGWSVTDPGIWINWYHEITAPGPLPTDEVDVFNNTVNVGQDEPLNPFSASYSMTVHAGERGAALHAMVSNIWPDSDIDLYVTDSSGAIVAQSQTRGNADDQVDITPEEGYRFESSAAYTIWVHGFDVNLPAGSLALPVSLHVWWDQLNVWLSAQDPDVHVSAIGAGEMVSVTLHFDKPGWMPGNPDLSARLLVGPSVLPNAFDELVTIVRADAPPQGWQWDEVQYSVNVQAPRGNPPYFYWVNTPDGSDSSTLIAAPGDVLTWTMRVTNTSAFTSAPLRPFLPDYNAFGGGADALSFSSFVYTPSVGTTTAVPWPGFGTRIYWEGSLGPGEAIEVIYTTEVNRAGWDLGYFGGTGVREGTLGNQYIGGLRPTDPKVWVFWDYTLFNTTGSSKQSSLPVVEPGEAFDYTIHLANPSAEDTSVYFSDPLPEEVTFVSATGGATYNAAERTVVWSGLLPGTALDSVNFNIRVTANTGLADGVEIANHAMLSDKFEGQVIANLWAFTDVDDGVSPDLSIKKTVNTLWATTGDALAYTIVFSNDGNEAAEDAVVEDEIPMYLDVITNSLRIDQGAGAVALPADAYDDDTHTLTWMGDLAAGDTYTITLQATVNDHATHNLALINPALVMADNYAGEAYSSALTEIHVALYIYLPIIFKAAP